MATTFWKSFISTSCVFFPGELRWERRAGREVFPNVPSKAVCLVPALGPCPRVCQAAPSPSPSGCLMEVTCLQCFLGPHRPGSRGLVTPFRGSLVGRHSVLCVSGSHAPEWG